MIEFGLGVQTDKAPAAYVEIAQLADRYGFDVVAPFSDLMNDPSICPAVLMAPYLRTARIGTTTANPFLIHPVELAGQTAFLDRLTEGRAYYAICRGAWLDSLGIEPAKPRLAIREAIEIFRHLFEDRGTTYEGQVFRLSAANRPKIKPYRTSVPVMIGTWGPKLAELAGELADEVKIGGTANPAMANVLRPAIAAGAARVGRSPESCGIVIGGVTVLDEDRERARMSARRRVAVYLSVIAQLDPTMAVPIEVQQRMQAAVASHDLDAAAALVADEWLEKCAFAGNARDIIRQIEAAATAGVKRIDFGSPHGLDELAGIRLLGEQVLPYFR